MAADLPAKAPVFDPKLLEDQNPMQTGEDPEPLRQYSNEARAYHSRYSELSQAHDEGKYHLCREGCLDLLTEPNVPYYTRIQILQMLSTILAPASAEPCLEEAAAMLAKMDQSKFQVQLLSRDNEMMQADLREDARKHFLAGETEKEQGIDTAVPAGEVNVTGGTHSEFDRILLEQRQLGIEAGRALRDTPGGGQALIAGEVDGEEQAKFNAKIEVQADRVREALEMQRTLDLQEEETARSELRSPVDSLFSRLSPGESMFRGSVKSAGLEGIADVLANKPTIGEATSHAAAPDDTTINESRARAEAARADLAASEAKMSDVTAQLRALNMPSEGGHNKTVGSAMGQEGPNLVDMPVGTGTEIPDGGGSGIPVAQKAQGRPEGETPGGKQAIEGTGAAAPKESTARAVFGALGMGKLVDKKGSKKGR